MLIAVRSRLVPEQQRRTLDELADELVLERGDRRSKRSAFWTMLTLSAVIASAGVLADSTATVIGAMIIAPLSTPIMGLALAAVRGERNGSLRYVVGGALLVIAVGVVFSWFPSTTPLADDAQITSRVSPGLLDLVAALATGLAGAVALARRDVAAVLPGVAIAISLVPPLAVVGVCLGSGELGWAFGAFLLFISNFVALELAGVFVFTVLGYESESASGERSMRLPYLKLTGLFLLVLVPLAANTTSAYLVGSWGKTVETEATAWVSGDPDARVTGVDYAGTTYVVHVEAPDQLPPSQELIDRLRGKVPSWIDIQVDLALGQVIDAGKVG